MATLPVVNSRDKNIAKVVAIVFLLLLVIYLFFWLKFYIADPPPFNPPLTTEMTMEEIELDNLKIEAGGSGGGEPSDDPIAPPTPQVQNVITTTDSKVSVHSGQSNKTNTNKPSENTAQTTQQSTNPFNKGGSEGGEGGGKGKGFGPDSGKDGKGGEGNQSDEGRVRYNEIDVDDIYTSTVISVQLKLTINAEGRVVSAQAVSAGTTTTDQRIINQVIAAAKSQLQYSKQENASLQVQWYTVKIVPH